MSPFAPTDDDLARVDRARGRPAHRIVEDVAVTVDDLRTALRTLDDLREPLACEPGCEIDAAWALLAQANTTRAWAAAALERCRMLEAQRDSERRHADEMVQRISDVTEALGEHRTPGRPLAEDVRELAHFDSAVRDFRDCEDKLMTARSELAKARQERDESGAALVAVRDALGCEPGGEVEAVRRLASERAQMLIECMRAGVHAPTPGDTLTPADFGKGEAGVLRLAALLNEAPEGAVVECGGRWRWGQDDAGWVGEHGVRSDARGLAIRAPLTVVAWPGGAS